jgi:hypothetical protein
MKRFLPFGVEHHQAFNIQASRGWLRQCPHSIDIPRLDCIAQPPRVGDDTGGFQLPDLLPCHCV